MILMDTHVWLYWVSHPSSLSAAALEAIDLAVQDNSLLVSSISVWEVSLLVKAERLQLSLPVEDWVARSEALPFLEFVPVDNRVALRANQLPEPLHRDPADRIIAATALLLDAALVTGDRKLRNYPHLQTVW